MAFFKTEPPKTKAPEAPELVIEIPVEQYIKMLCSPPFSACVIPDCKRILNSGVKTVKFSADVDALVRYQDLDSLENYLIENGVKDEKKAEIIDWFHKSRNINNDSQNELAPGWHPWMFSSGC
ncbi:hypothetical protein [Legionella rubrilucens]|uniref:hypothetical protein n=1 Tax=Legionella rubrilucens TaxID=458 RepID=UPI0007308C11|nr:hypothetical protein [Legionella rubrilucens]